MKIKRHRRESLSDSRKNLITWNGFIRPDRIRQAEAWQPLPIPYQYPGSECSSAKEESNHDDALLHREPGGLLNNFLVLCIKTPHNLKIERTTDFVFCNSQNSSFST